MPSPSTPTPNNPKQPQTADTANSPQLKKIYHNSSLALAGLVPLAVFQQQGDLFGRAVDVGLNVALPVHSHIAMNYVVTDYVPKGIRGAARWGVLGSSLVIAAGMLKLNVAGPGVTATVKALWKGGEAGFAPKKREEEEKK
jgi:succinate dehydrogenase (ubiquinone) membrane anchor subunit